MADIKRPVLHAIIHDPAESVPGDTESEDEWDETESECENADDYFSVGSDEAEEEVWSECECEDDSEEEEAYIPRPSKRRRQVSDSGIALAVGGPVVAEPVLVNAELAEGDTSFIV